MTDQDLQPHPGLQRVQINPLYAQQISNSMYTHLFSNEDQSAPDSGHLHLVQRDPEVGLADLDEVVFQLGELLHQAVEDLGGGRQ